VDADRLFVLERLHHAVELHRDAHGRFEPAADKRLRVKVAGLEVEVETAEDISILHEIFVLGAYNVSLGRPHVVLDVGMNAGFASLYFASKPDVARVFAYEPIPATFAQASRNLAHNPSAAAKVVARAAGLGDADRRQEVEYSYRLKGHTSLCRGDGYLQGVVAPGEIERTTVEVKAATAAIDEIERDMPGYPILAKVDCEGMEYDIVSSWARTGGLQRLEALAVEWHWRGPDPIIEALTKAGFATIGSSESGREAGMVYAFRIHASR
jgi:FkbM family methyltransferase